MKCRRAEGSRASLLRDDVDEGVPLGTLDAKLDHTMRRGEQGVIRADADVDAGAIHRPALTNQDIACQHILAAELLDAQALGMRIAAIAITAACFFVCLEISPKSLKRRSA
jgi:hypothetical protein